MKKFQKLRAEVVADPKRAVRVELFRCAMEDAMRLAEIREHRQLSQGDAARGSSLSQGRISQIEHAPDLYLSTLNQYVQGLGGHLQIAAVFDDEVISIAVTPS